MAQEHIACPACGADDSDPWGAENGYQAVSCRSCGLLYVTPRPSGDQISEATRIGMHQTEAGQLNLVAKRYPARIAALADRIRTMFRDEIAAGRPMRWLDVGAGFGETVEAAMAALPAGSEVTGVEPMQPKVAAARALGLPIVDTPLADLSGGYDVISLINVFSHIPDFKDFGAQIARLLAPGGSVWIETGNVANVTRSQYPDRLYLPDHLVFAGPEQMTRILSDLGLTVVLVDPVRVDGPLYTLKNIIKSVVDGRPQLRLPWTSPFRQVHYKATLNG